VGWFATAEEMGHQSGPINPTQDPYDPDNFTPGTYIEDYSTTAEPSLVHWPCHAGPKEKGQRLMFVRDVPLMKRNIDTGQWASLPASITGVLPAH